MTKPTPPRANSSPVVEIDAMDVMEWQHGQRTPQASDANLAALVKQSAKGESAPIAVEPARKPAPIVPRVRTRATEGPGLGVPAGGVLVTGVPAVPPVKPRSGEPPRRPSDLTGKPPAFPAIATPVPPRMAAASASPPSRPSPRPRAGDVPMSVSGYPIYRGANGSSDAHPALEAPPAMVAPVEAVAPPVVLPLPAPAETPRPMQAPSPWAPPAAQSSVEPSPYPVLARQGSAEPFALGLGDQQTGSSPGVDRDRELEPRNRRGGRRAVWLVGASAVAAAALAVIVLAGGSDTAAPPVAPAPVVAASPTEAPAEPAAAAPVVAPVAVVPDVTDPLPTRKSVVRDVHMPEPAHPAVALATPTATPPARPIHAAPRATHRFAKKIVVDYQSHRDETPVPSLVAQASEDPAIARARNAYLSGNDKLFAGDARGAITAYREALDLYPGYVGGYRGLGLAYALLGDHKKAIDALKSYVSAAPNAKDAALIKQRIARLAK